MKSKISLDRFAARPLRCQTASLPDRKIKNFADRRLRLLKAEACKQRNLNGGLKE